MPASALLPVPADVDLARLLDALRILTMDENFWPSPLAPEKAIRAGRILFAAMPSKTLDDDRQVSRYADRGKLDLIVPELLQSGPGKTFALGYHFNGHRVWLRNQVLWRPADASVAWFVPAVGDIGLFSRALDGRLIAAELAPWSDADDRDRGLAAAASGLKRLVEGR